MSPFSFLNAHTRGDLSAYIDGELTPAKAARIEAHLAACDACAAEAEALRQVKLALGDLPEPAVPRSFALTPAMVEQRPAAPAPRPSFQGLANGFRLASAGLAFMLAVVVVIDSQGGGSNGGSGDAVHEANAPAAADSIAGDGEIKGPTTDEGSGDPRKDLQMEMTPVPAPEATEAAEGGISGIGGVGGGGATGAPLGIGGGPNDAGAETPASTFEATPAPDTQGAERIEQTDGDGLSTGQAYAPGATAPAQDSSDEFAAPGADGDDSGEAAGLTALDASGDGGDSVDVVLAIESFLATAVALALLVSFAGPRLARRSE